MFLLKNNIRPKTLFMVIVCSLPIILFSKILFYKIMYYTDDYDYNVGVMLVSLKKLEVCEADKIVEMEINRRTIFNNEPTNITLKFDYSNKKTEDIKKYYKQQSEIRNWLYRQVGDEIILSKKYGKDNILLTLKPEEKQLWSMNIVNRPD